MRKKRFDMFLRPLSDASVHSFFYVLFAHNRSLSSLNSLSLVQSICPFWNKIKKREPNEVERRARERENKKNVRVQNVSHFLPENSSVKWDVLLLIFRHSKSNTLLKKKTAHTLLRQMDEEFLHVRNKPSHSPSEHRNILWSNFIGHLQQWWWRVYSFDEQHNSS